MKCIVLVVSLVTIGVATAEFSTSDRYGEQKFDAYVVRNNIWGKNHGTQKLTAQSGTHFCVDCSHTNKGGIKSYPHSGYMINKPISQVHALKSNYGASVAKGQGLDFAFTYDIWLQNHKYEIMIWLDQCGDVGPIGTSCGTDDVKIGGHTWKSIYKGSNGYNMVFSFISKSPGLKGSIDLKAIIDYCEAQKWFNEGTATKLDEIQLGFEISATPPNSKLCLETFSVTCT